MNAAATQQTTVAIVGAGPVGLAMALALAQLDLQVTLIEKNPDPVSTDPRIVVLNQSSVQLLHSFGLGEQISQYGQPIDRICFRQAGSLITSHFVACEHALTYFAQVISLPHLIELLRRQIDRHDRIQVLQPWSPQSVVYEGTALVLGNGQSRVTAQLVIAVDGSHSAMVRMLGITQQSKHSNQQAVFSKVTLSESLQGFACEVFCRDLTLVLIPDGGREARLIQIVPMQATPADMLTVNKAFAGMLPHITRIEPVGAFPLVTSQADEIIRPRCIIAGNAARTMHPLLAQGLNLAYTHIRLLHMILRKNIPATNDPGHWDTLRAYQAGALQRDARTVLSVNTVRTIIDANLPLSFLLCLLNQSIMIRNQLVAFAGGHNRIMKG